MFGLCYNNTVDRRLTPIRAQAKPEENTMSDFQKHKDDFDAFLDSVSTKGEIASRRNDSIMGDNDAAADREADEIVEGKSQRKKYACGVCNGTGRYLGPRVRQDQEHCFACRGTGAFYTSEDARKKNRVKPADRKKKSTINSLNLFDEANPGLRAWLQAFATGNAFAASIHSKLLKYGDLTERQFAAVSRMKAEAELPPEDKAAKAAAWDAAHPAFRDFLKASTSPFMIELLGKLEKFGDLSPAQLSCVEREMRSTIARASVTPTLDRLAAAFLLGSEHIKFPKLRLRTEDGLRVVLSRAGAQSKEPGTINITDGGPFGANKFYGRIMPDGRFFDRNPPQSVLALLTAFNADPKAEIKVQGLRTGECCVCGRELSDPASIAAGIGPVCASRFGF